MKWKLSLLLLPLVFSELALAQEPHATAPVRHITLQEAVQLALKQNHNVRIAGYKVDEKQHVKEAAKSAYFPTIRNESNFVRITDTQLIQIQSW